ncbi:MAG: shikimate dehydrogenase [Bacteroidales bacterium]|jgi:shikimate dehydrogenase|nr:shikimate dehydrogenase [Bacteroidales bacterium]
MRKFGLVGYPLGHSFSKQYFTGKFRREHEDDCVYENYPVHDIEQITGIINSDAGLCGLNITIPYKTAILRLLDYVSEEAMETGAVNVVKIKRTGSSVLLYGYNSDITGVSDSLSQYIAGIRQALILGTGGASKAVHYALKKAGVTATSVSRHKKEGALAYTELTPQMLAATQLIVNTTPLGMFPDTESFPDIDYRQLGRRHILFDLVYNPEITAFLRKGTEQGCTVITGTRMLHSQAEKAWQIWNNDLL